MASLWARIKGKGRSFQERGGGGGGGGSGVGGVLDMNIVPGQIKYNFFTDSGESLFSMLDITTRQLQSINNCPDAYMCMYINVLLFAYCIQYRNVCH